jgi:hypothetical protein
VEELKFSGPHWEETVSALARELAIHKTSFGPVGVKEAFEMAEMFVKESWQREAAARGAK